MGKGTRPWMQTVSTILIWTCRLVLGNRAKRTAESRVRIGVSGRTALFGWAIEGDLRENEDLEEPRPTATGLSDGVVLAEDWSRAMHLIQERSAAPFNRLNPFNLISNTSVCIP